MKLRHRDWHVLCTLALVCGLIGGRPQVFSTVRTFLTSPSFAVLSISSLSGFLATWSLHASWMASSVRDLDPSRAVATAWFMDTLTARDAPRDVYGVFLTFLHRCPLVVYYLNDSAYRFISI